MARDPFLADLDAHQFAAVTSDAAPLAILAPAGSGKTRVLTRRIAWRVRERECVARHVLAVTFTRKAAGELIDRLRRLDVREVTAGTLHALALAQLRARAIDRGGPPPTVLERKGRILGPLLAGRNAASAAQIADVAAEIEWAKARLVRTEDYAAAASQSGRRLPRPADEIADLYRRYEAEKRRRRLLDFDDLLWWCARAIDTDDEFAAAQRWRFRHLFVDEFQDASPLQVQLVRAWLGGRTDLCVVGDPAQAIYSFAGADPSYLAEFGRHFPGGQTLELTRNYRSSPQVVVAASAALDASGRRRSGVAVAVRGDGPAATLTEYETGESEARAVADEMWRAYTRGVSWREMAVLFRTNAQSGLLETALAARGVPFRVPGAGRFADRPEVRTLLERLGDLERAAPGRPFAEHLADLTAPGADEADDGPNPEPTSTPGDEHRDAIVELGRDYLATETTRGSIAAFTAWLDVSTRDESQGTAGVELATFHRAKGLEWNSVWVVGLEHGLVPISYADRPDLLAEEARLLHVALSRAEQELHCSWSRTRQFGSRPSARRPSPWLDNLSSAISGSTDVVLDIDAQLADARAVLAAAQPPAPVSRRERRARRGR